ncbi:MAG: hypothetical protein EBS54_08715, partial [Betaproteobacteria bacterium]|nr:hypothetical protein [Betaproteobacteria bacterium]
MPGALPPLPISMTPSVGVATLGLSSVKLSVTRSVAVSRAPLVFKVIPDAWSRRMSMVAPETSVIGALPWSPYSRSLSMLAEDKSSAGGAVDPAAINRLVNSRVIRPLIPDLEMLMPFAPTLLV